MKHTASKHSFPSSFTLRALEPDYSLSARDMTFVVTARQRVNAEITVHGSPVLTGWKKTASRRFFFHVHRPKNETVARKTVTQAMSALASTIGFMQIVPDYALGLMTGISLGFYPISVKSSTKPVKNAAILHDAISDLRTAILQRATEIEIMLTAPVPGI